MMKKVKSIFFSQYCSSMSVAAASSNLPGNTGGLGFAESAIIPHLDYLSSVFWLITEIKQTKISAILASKHYFIITMINQFEVNSLFQGYRQIPTYRNHEYTYYK